MAQPGPLGVLNRPEHTPLSELATGAVPAPPEAVAPPPGHPRFPLLDSLRALAALGVLAAHVTIFVHTDQGLSWGVLPANLDIGVTLFFVLSGFLLFRPFFSAELGQAPTPRVRDYARRRALRIVPAYWFALTVLTIYPGNKGVFSGDWWRYYGFLQFYSHHTAGQGMGIAWTLCIEVAFYATLPLYAWLTRRAGRRLRPAARVRLQLVVLALLAVGSIVLRVADQNTEIQNSLLTHLYWFALGMGLAVLSVALHGRERQPRAVGLVIRRPELCWLAAVGVYLTMCAVLSSAPQHLLYSVSQSFWQHVLSGVFATLMVLPAVFGGNAGGWPRRLLAHPWLAWLGLISYGIYLWHASIAIALIQNHLQDWLPLLLCVLLLTIAIAGASYHLLERPLLKLKYRRRRQAIVARAT